MVEPIHPKTTPVILIPMRSVLSTRGTKRVRASGNARRAAGRCCRCVPGAFRDELGEASRALLGAAAARSRGENLQRTGIASRASSPASTSEHPSTRARCARNGSNRTRTPPLAPCPARIKLVNSVLPRHDLVLKPDAPVRADVGRFGEAARLLHAVQRGATDRDNFQNLPFVEHAARTRSSRCYVLRFGFALICRYHCNLKSVAGSAAPTSSPFLAGNHKHRM